MSGEANKVGELYVELAARAQPFNAGLAAASTRFNAFGAAITSRAAAFAAATQAALGSITGGLFGALGMGLAVGGVAGIGLAIGKAIAGASDLNETINKVGVIFGDQAKIVTAGADEMAAKFGIVKTEFMDSAAEIGNLLQGMGGYAEKEAADVSVQLTKLAADASSIFNKSFDEAKGKIASALRGQSEPISEFGLDLQEAAVKAEAARLGIAKVGAELTTQQKVAARASLLMEGLKVAQGDLAATSGGFANAFRASWGRIQNVLATFGTSLLPLIEGFLSGFNKMLAGLQSWADRAMPYVTAFSNGFLEVVGYVQWALGQVTEALSAHVQQAAAFWSEAITQTEAYKVAVSFLTGVWEGLKATAKEVFETIGIVFRNFSNIMADVSIRAQMWWALIVEAFRWAGQTIVTLAEWAGSNWKDLFLDAFSAVMTALQNLGKNFADFGAAALDWLKSGMTGAFNFSFTPLLDGFKSTVSQLPEIAGPNFDKVRAQYQGMLDAIQEQEVKTEEKRLDELNKPTEKKTTAAAARAKRTPLETPGKGDKEKKAEFVGLAEMARKLQVDILGKGSQFRKLEDLGERSAKAAEETAQNTAMLRQGVPAIAT